MQSRWHVLLMLGLAACDGLPRDVRRDCNALASRPATLELGTGADTFEPLGDSLLIEFGPQGGWHAYGSLRTTGLYPATNSLDPSFFPLVTFTIEATEDGFRGGYETLSRRLAAEGDTGATLVGELLIFNTVDIDRLEGAPVLLNASVTDACGRTAFAEGTSILDSGDS